MRQPLVTVVLLREQGESSMADAVSSLKNQTISDYEVTVAATARQGIRESHGEYVAFLDSGHVWKRRKLEIQLNRLTSNPALHWCYCSADTQGRVLPSGNILRPLLLNNFIQSSCVMARRSVLDILGNVDESGGCGLINDWDTWLRLAARYAVDFIAEPLTFRAPQVQMTEAEDIEAIYRSRQRVIEAAVARHRQQLADLRSQSLAQICVSAGHSYLKAQSRVQARHKFAEALTHNPHCSDAYLSWIASFLSWEVQQQIQDLKALARHTQAAADRSQDASLRL